MDHNFRHEHNVLALVILRTIGHNFNENYSGIIGHSQA